MGFYKIQRRHDGIEEYVASTKPAHALQLFMDINPDQFNFGSFREVPETEAKELPNYQWLQKCVQELGTPKTFYLGSN